MNPLEARIELLEAQLAQLIKSDRYMIAKTMQFNDGRNIQVGQTTGTKIATASAQKLGFFGTTPVTQRTGVAVTADGIHGALVSLGLITA